MAALWRLRTTRRSVTMMVVPTVFFEVLDGS